VERVDDAGEVSAVIPPNGKRDVTWKASLGREDYGAEIRVTLRDQPDTVRRDFFGVSAKVGKVGILGGSRFANYTDEFAWAPDDFGNLSPAGDDWWSGQGGGRRNKAALKKKLADGHARGVKALTYGKGVAGGADGIRLLLDHPDWSAFNRFGQLGGLDMSFDVWALKHWDDPGRTWRFWHCWTPNFMSEDTVRYGADAIVKGARMFGFDGVRFDGQFDIFGGYDLTGCPLPQGSARDDINARNVRVMKKAITRHFPDFAFGYNYGVPMAIPSALDRAVSGNGGMVMDEGIRNASDPQHPLQDWQLYARHIRALSAAVRNLGGVPLIFYSDLRGAALNYAIGFCLAGGGTPYAWDFSRGTRAYDAFAVRFSGLLWNAEYPWVKNPETAVRVSADGSRDIWWRDWMRAGLAPAGSPRVILHLVNPPAAKLIRDTLDMPQPLTGIRIEFPGVKDPEGLTAWLLTCDSEPRVKRLQPIEENGTLLLKIDSLEHWGMLVLEGGNLKSWLAGIDTTPCPEDAGPSTGTVEPPSPAPALDLKPFAGNMVETGTTARALSLENGRILLANRFVRFEIDPKRGGRIASFVDRRDGLERIVPGRLEGMFFDNMYDQDAMLYQGQWGVNQAAPYTGAIIDTKPGQAGVRVSREAFAVEAGVTNENYRDLTIEREFRLADNAVALECVIRLRNTGPEGRCPAYSLRNGYVDGLHREKLRYFRPSRRGIHPAGPSLPETDQMIWDPAAGWTATADQESGRGAAWLMEAGRVMMFYNCIEAVTGRHIEAYPNEYGVDPLYLWDNASITAIGADWYYRRAFIPAGGAWETRVTLMPLQGVTGVVAHACAKAVVCVEWAKPGEPVRVNLLPGSELLLNPTVSLEADGRTIHLERTSGGPAAPSHWMTPQAPAARVVQFIIRGTDEAGQPVTVTFPFVIEPTAMGEPPLLPTPPVASPGVTASLLPARGQITHAALLLEGLGFERWGLESVLKRQGLSIRESEFMKRRIATCVRYLPASLEEAQQFNLIVLGAVDAFALSHEGVAILKDYVRSGGSLLVLGGFYSYGGGRFQEFGLDEILPLRVKTTFDLKQPEGKAKWDPAVWKSFGGGTAVPALNGIAWAHELEAAPDAEVWIRIGQQPLVAASTLGKGRVVAVAATTLGDETGAGVFWKRPAWDRTMDKMVQWLEGRQP
jgi:uncharacterized membrane protein